MKKNFVGETRHTERFSLKQVHI